MPDSTACQHAYVWHAPAACINCGKSWDDIARENLANAFAEYRPRHWRNRRSRAMWTDEFKSLHFRIHDVIAVRRDEHLGASHEAPEPVAA